MRVEVERQVVDFIRTRAPEPRKVLRAALRALQRERGDIKALEGPLREYYRLRVKDYRIIFRYHLDEDGALIRCIYAERRSIIYEVFERLVTEGR